MLRSLFECVALLMLGLLLCCHTGAADVEIAYLTEEEAAAHHDETHAMWVNMGPSSGVDLAAYMADLKASLGAGRWGNKTLAPVIKEYAVADAFSSADSAEGIMRGGYSGAVYASALNRILRAESTGGFAGVALRGLCHGGAGGL
jgi:hypothetical protein